MISLEQDIRESTDSLDTILKRHNTNLHEIFHSYPKKVTVEGDEYEQFKEYYYNHLDLNAHDIQRMLKINSYKWMKFSQKAIEETGLERVRGRGGTKIRRSN